MLNNKLMICCSTELYIAFDFFDTLVKRDCEPEQTLYEWSKNMARKLCFAFSPSRLYDVRKSAERNAKQDGKEELSYKELIHKTYDALGIFSIPEEDFYCLSKKIEVDVELSHISGVDENLNQISALAKDHKIILISDFYADSDLFERILTKLNVRKYFTKLYISSELDARKSTGHLYEYVLKDLHIEPKDLLMVGDNEQSDYKVPMKLGIHTHKYNPVEGSYCISSAQDIRKLYLKIFREYKTNALGGYVPEIMYFISKLHEELTKREVHLALFCSREGQLLKYFFDEYQKCFYSKDKIQTEYFCVSRKSTFLPSLHSFSEEKFNNLFRQFTRLKLEDFLSSIGFEKEEIACILSEIGLEKKQMISNDLDDPIRKKLEGNKYFISLYNQKRVQQKKNFISYIESFGIDLHKDIINLVDIGWKGTIQDNITSILPEYAKVQGFYFGLRLNEYSSDNKNLKTGIMFTDYPVKSKNFDLLNRDFMFWERIFVADHGPVVGYRRTENGVEPVKDNSESQLNIYYYMKPFQEGMKKAFDDILAEYSGSKYLPYELYSLMIEFALRKKCMYFPRIWHIEKTARATSQENFGDISKNNVHRKESFGIEQKNKKDFLFVDYAYRLLDRCHLKILYPLATLYCHLVYLIKRNSVEK